MAVNFRLTQGNYLSLSAPFEWCDIPPFAVLTGPNGSGKTQLLNLICQTALRNHHGEYKTSLEGLECAPTDVVWQDANWTIPQHNPVTFQHLEQHQQHRQNLAARRIAASKPKTAFLGIDPRFANLNTQTPDVLALADALPEGILLTDKKDPRLIIQELGVLFRQHHLDRLELKCADKTEEEIRRVKGPPLWEVANEILAKSSLQYRLTAPEYLKIREPYTLQIISQDNNVTISPSQLSSGESILFSLMVSLFASQQFGVHPSLLLLDEPDAHLHTTQIRPFLHVVRNLLVHKYGCHVVMTTHRPDTIVQVETGELFEMSRSGQPRIRPCASRSSLLASITSYVVDVLPSTRCVYVEDDKDVIYYTNIKDALCRHEFLAKDPNLVFCSASLGHGKQKIPGGFSPVMTSVKKLRNAGLHMVCGIVDNDGQRDRKLPDGVFTAVRYNIENYLYDPLLIYCLLLHNNRPPAIPGMAPLAPGEEIRLMEMERATLQSIIDTIVPMMESNIPNLTAANRSSQCAKLVHGQELHVPQWLVEMNGHNLEAPAHKIDGIINKDGLAHMLLCSRLVYQDFCDLFIKIQTT